MPRRLALALTLAALFAPAPAAASTLTDQGGGVLRFTADAGDTNVIDIRNGPNVTVRRLAGDTDPITSFPPSCVISQQGVEYLCQNVTRIVVDVSGGNDSVDASALTGVAIAVTGGDGADALVGGPLADTLDGGPGTRQPRRRRRARHPARRRRQRLSRGQRRQRFSQRRRRRRRTRRRRRSGRDQRRRRDRLGTVWHRAGVRHRHDRRRAQRRGAERGRQRC